MSLLRLIAAMFAPHPANGDKPFSRSRLSAGRPHGHFREFTLPRRLQRGGGVPAGGRGGRVPGLDGIIPRAGENIP